MKQNSGFFAIIFYCGLFFMAPFSWAGQATALSDAEKAAIKKQQIEDAKLKQELLKDIQKGKRQKNSGSQNKKYSTVKGNQPVYSPKLGEETERRFESRYKIAPASKIKTNKKQKSGLSARPIGNKPTYSKTVKQNKWKSRFEK